MALDCSFYAPLGRIEFSNKEQVQGLIWGPEVQAPITELCMTHLGFWPTFCVHPIDHNLWQIRNAGCDSATDYDFRALCDWSVQSLSGHTSAVESVTFDSAEALVVAGAASGTIKLWDLEEAKSKLSLT